MATRVKTLIYDIEILQNTLGDPWHTMSADKSFITCFGYKWAHEKKAHSIDLLDVGTFDKLGPFNDKSDTKLVKEAHKIMKEADLLVAHYGNKFDWKYMNAKFDKVGLDHLSYLPKRDTCLKARHVYKLSSNRLKNLAKFFNVKLKDDIEFQHWMNLYTGNKSSMKAISKYCRGDVESLHQIYDKMRHHFPAVYHEGVMNGEHKAVSCPECGGLNVIKRGAYATKGGTRKQRLSCNNCSHNWSVTITKEIDILLG